MKALWRTVWVIVAVIVLGEVYLFYSGRLTRLFSPTPTHASVTTEERSNVQQLTQEELPVHVVTPPSFGQVVFPELRNSSAKQFALRVTVRRRGSNEQHEWLIELQPNQTLSLVRQGGWTFAGGDELELVQDGYRPRKVQLQ